ncbi:AEC family transporter [Aquiflexum sp. LQ15W]|uniref:AEC family transporter n=1 Tax=Cognataquiflexum nitidum TaxID=2922272 RepID=UPI001F13162D|nr:AEC family transporter [Cognataquiflexum nitidum]MCH6199839.1 AEC family transporter [Cognataquiflexum nitidum]
MVNILLIVVFLLLGFFLQRFKFVPANTSKYLNNYLIYVVLPALALRYLPQIKLRTELFLPVAAAWIGFGLSWLIFGTLGKKYGWGNSITGCLVITAGLANTSFVGIPIMQALYGEEAVIIALLIDQAGSFIIVSSVAVIVASIYSVGKKRKRDITRKILTFPPFLFFLIAFGLNFYGLEIGGRFEALLQVITATLTPVALTSVGLQVKVDFAALKSKFLWYGLSYKLLLIPLVILLLFKYVFQLEGLILQVSVMEAAMAPMITGSIIAITHDLEPKLASLLVGIGIPLSFFTLAIWYFILS